jgi:hypothetical protein
VLGRALGANLHQVAYGFQDALQDAARATILRCIAQKKSPQEPDFVAGIVLDATSKLQKTLSKALSPYGIPVSIVSVYCHQTPSVRYVPRTKGCELGDVLLVHVHNGRTEKRRNALLLQAKMVGYDRQYRLPKRDLRQQTLYSQWPDFIYTKPTSLQGRRCVSPKSMHPGAKYLVIDKTLAAQITPAIAAFSSSPLFCACLPYRTLCNYRPLAEELVEFLLCQTGRPFVGKAEAQNSIGWSRVMWELITSSINKAIVRANSGLHTESRIAGDLSALDGAFFAASSGGTGGNTTLEEVAPASNQLFFGSDDHHHSVDRDDLTSEPSVSLVLVETSEPPSEAGAI